MAEPCPRQERSLQRRHMSIIAEVSDEKLGPHEGAGAGCSQTALVCPTSAALSLYFVAL